MNMGVHKSETCYNFLDLQKSLSPDKSKARTKYQGKSKTVIYKLKRQNCHVFLCVLKI